MACIAGRGSFDDAASAMLCQLLSRAGVTTRRVSHGEVSRDRIAQLDLSGVSVVALSYLDMTGSASHLRYLVRRLRQHAPKVTIVVGLWPAGEEQEQRAQQATREQAIGADAYVGSLRQAIDTIGNLRSVGASDREVGEPVGPESPPLHHHRLHHYRDTSSASGLLVCRSPEGRPQVAAATPAALIGHRLLERVELQVAAGTSSSVRNRHSDWPPMIVTAIAERCAPPMPRPSAVGMQAGDDRARSSSESAAAGCGTPRSIASRSGTPRAPQHVGVVHLQDRVLLDDAEQQQDAERAPQVQRAARSPRS